MLEMTRNDYAQYCKDCVAKGNYKALHEEVNILPLDLSKYPQITKETADWMNRLFMEETTDSNGIYMLKGRCENSHYITECSRLNCNETGISYYAGYGFNDKELLVYEYAEGDTTLQVFSDKETYEKEKERTRQWYKENELR